jgi:uncharacterized protein (DUF488 family)
VNAQLQLYTIGHSNVPAERIVELLKQHGIEVLVDVRSKPFSRWNPQFNRERWQRTLEAAGIEYRYSGKELGGRPEDEALYVDGQVSYGAIAASAAYQEALQQVIALAAEKHVALMCAEEDPQRCHRQHLLAQSLLSLGVKVRHIRGDGRVEEAAGEPIGATGRSPLQKERRGYT